MGLNGRPAKPAALKELQGNAGKRKLITDPVAADARPACPRWLDDEARAEWRRVCGDLHAAGILKTVDRTVLAAYCQAYSRWRTAEESVRKTGQVLKSANGGYYMNPYLSAAQLAMKEMLNTAAQLGMTPSARARLAVAPTENKHELADMLFEAVMKDERL